MLPTLLKIGEHLLEGQGIWARLTTEPKFDDTNEKDRWICPIVFDCVDQKILLPEDQLIRFRPNESSIDFRYVNTDLWGRRGRKCALTVETRNFAMLPETLFGKGGGGVGPMQESIKEYSNDLARSEIYIALAEINFNLKNLMDDLDPKKIKDQTRLGSNDEIVLYYSLIRSTKIRNGKISRLVDLEGFEDFIIGRFGTSGSTKTGLDYITGEYTDQVGEASFTGRYNIHKIFQTTTLNYASGFSDFSKNFQIGIESIAYLDKVSSHILKKQTRLAGVSHIIIPNYLHKDLKKINIEETELFLTTSSDLLFQVIPLNRAIKKDLPDVKLFWINYIAFESDGNSFKIINHIKDVNSLYLKKMISSFKKTHLEFQKYIGGRYEFNLQSIYSIIPVREGKDEKNPVLLIFKAILEQQKINPTSLYRHFIKYIQCHRNKQFDEKKRHRAFTNIREFDAFDYAAYDGIFKYLALTSALNKLNLTFMTDQAEPKVEDLQRQYPNKDIDELLSLKNCTRNQVALFCLGRALNTVAYAQERKEHASRPILNQIKFNGMDLSDTKSLTRALMEKAKQYQQVKTSRGTVFPVRKKVEANLDLFNKYLDENNWTVTEEEAVFYLLAGYVFRPSSADGAASEEGQEPENNDAIS